MVDKINLDAIDKELYIIGKLTKEIIGLLGLKLSETEIIIWKDRLKYIEKHKPDFKTEADYKKHVEAMPEILNSPDYIGLHPKGDSIQYIKRIDELMLVGIRIKLKGKLVVRSSYPITQDTLNSYLLSGTVKEVPKKLAD